MKKFLFNRLISFRNAFTGIVYNARKGSNFKIQILAAVLALCVAVIFRISTSDWIIIILMISLVLAFEAMNTSIENICDRFLNSEDTLVRIIKDSAAGAVLIISIGALLVGIIVFLPYLRVFLSN